MLRSAHHGNVPQCLRQVMGGAYRAGRCQVPLLQVNRGFVTRAVGADIERVSRSEGIFSPPKHGLNKLHPVIPAKAGIQRLEWITEPLDPGFRGDDDLF
jgi:hypothetical protein